MALKADKKFTSGASWFILFVTIIAAAPVRILCANGVGHDLSIGAICYGSHAVMSTDEIACCNIA